MRQPPPPRRKGRLAVLLVLCLAVFALFLGRLVWMQFARADYYTAKATQASSVRYTVPLPAARGAITDRDGNVLAQDQTVYDLYLRYPAPPGTDMQQTLQQLQQLPGGEDVETHLAAFCSTVSGGELPVAQALTPAQCRALYAAGLVQSGAVRLAPRGVRQTPGGVLFPHLLGLVGAVTPEQWPALQAQGVAMDAAVGQSGLELAFDALLRGTPGTLRQTVGRDGTLRDSTTLRAPQPGATLHLTVNSALQAVVQQALQTTLTDLQTNGKPGEGREATAGAAVVVEVQTGAILAAASVPGFDLSRYRTDYAALATDPAAPLLDRVCRGLYAPGSTFKPAVAVAALLAGQNPAETVWCAGRYDYYAPYRPRCLQYGHSGPVDLSTALAYSCNCYFYEMGRRVGADGFAAVAEQLGLGQLTAAELPQAEGRLTRSTDENFTPGLTPQAAIGQGNTAVTPLQLAGYAATLASGGQHPALHFVAQATTPDGTVVYTPDLTPTTVPGGPEVFGPVQQGMARMAQTTRLLREAPVPCAAKTGSPQLSAFAADGTRLVHAVLIGFAPVEQPRIAVAVVLEQGGGGSRAVPVLRAVLDRADLWQ